LVSTAVREIDSDGTGWKEVEERERGWIDSWVGAGAGAGADFDHPVREIGSLLM
jgi:hypothetical protein